MKRGAIVIPARYKSSRFEGKPLADINGRTMIQCVYERCIEAVGRKRVYVATDDDSIRSAVESFGGKVVMTSTDCLTGTDRLAEVNESLDFDFLVNVQGDEPMVSSLSIKSIFEIMEKDSSKILNCYCDIEHYEVNLATVPKVTVSESGRLIYMSRGGCPFDKQGHSQAKYKQVCIYGFGREHLRAFASHPIKTQNEIIEDIEILRFIDLDFEVNMVKVEAGSVAVDTPKDLELVRSLMMSGG